MKLEDLKKTEKYQRFWNAMKEVSRLDYWALKTQVFLEARLKHLLAVRLDVPAATEDDWIKQFETINYHHLVLLALPQEQEKTLRDDLIKLNNVRKEIAHWFQTVSYLRPLRKFAESVRDDQPWPQTEEEQAVYCRTALAFMVTLIEFRIQDLEEVREHPHRR